MQHNIAPHGSGNSNSSAFASKRARHFPYVTGESLSVNGEALNKEGYFPNTETASIANTPNEPLPLSPIDAEVVIVDCAGLLGSSPYSGPVAHPFAALQVLT
jgi:hypothetical protein